MTSRNINLNIDFNEIDSKQFEELCFELLWELGLNNLVWRGGPNDQGRDIEGNINIEYRLLGTISESWHFECKKYKESVNQNVLIDKINWADVNNPDKLIFLLSSKLSNQARIWLEKINKTKNYRIHVIEGIELKRLLLNYPHLVKKYFSQGDYGLLKDHMKMWLIHECEPSTTAITHLLVTLDMKKLSNEEIIFLFSIALLIQNRIFENDEGVWQFDFNNIAKELLKRIKNRKRKVLPNYSKIFRHTNNSGTFFANNVEFSFYVTEIYIENEHIFDRAIHCIISEDGKWWEYPFGEKIIDKGYECLLMANTNFESKFRTIPKDSFKYLNDIYK